MNDWNHDHSFGQLKKKSGEFHTLIVIALTFTTTPTISRIMMDMITVFVPLTQRNRAG